MEQYQSEGTALFDAVRPSIILDQVYAMQDVRRIAAWKRDGIKDGRALVRWALSFVDRSALAGQMQVVKDLHAAKLTVHATLFELEEHLASTWELWLALANSNRSLPADYFRILLMSMPTEPECPVVCLRRWLVDLIERADSPLLTDLDSESGLFAKMRSYGASLGIKEAAPASLALLRGGASAGGGENDKDSTGNGTQECCNAYACPDKKNTPDGFCICHHRSSIPLNSIANKGRREYVKLMRTYSAANPDKSLKVDIQLVKKKLGKTTGDGDKSKNASTGSAQAAAQPAVNFMASVASVLGEEVTDKKALDDWLAKHNGTDGFYVMGDLSGEGELNFAVLESGSSSAAASAHTPDEHLESSASSRCSARSSTEAELEIVRLKAALEVAELKNKQLEALPTSLRAPPATPAAPPAPPVTPAVTEEPRPNPALDRPSSFGVDVTPRELFRRWEQSPARARLMSTGARFRTPRTLIRTPIKEETTDDSAGGADDSGGGAGKSATEHFARGIVAVETEKRKLKDKSKRKLTLAGLGRALLRALASAVRRLKFLLAVSADYAGDLTIHQLLTLSLLAYAFGRHLKPVVRWFLAKSASLMLSSAAVRVRALVARAHAAIVSTLAMAITRVLTAVSSKLPRKASTQTAAAAVQAAPDLLPPLDGQLMPLVNESLGDAVLMAAHEMTLSDELRPALMDNGASKGTNCCRTLEGVVPGTHKAEDAGDIGLGKDGATLESLGSHVYALERFGVDSSEIVLRRMKHTPKLPMPMVFSEATESKLHGYGIYWRPGHPREIQAPNGTTLKLFMSSTELGWLKVRPITDPAELMKLFAGGPARDQSLLTAMNPAAVRTVGMGTVKELKGVALLRRRHCTDGHVALPTTVKNLRLEGAFDDGRLSVKDVELFAEQGCGTCELAKMRRRAFSLKVQPDDPTPPVLGKHWTIDVLELRVPCVHSGATFVYAAVEKVSKMAMSGRMQGYTQEDVERAINGLKCRVRPTHGEIFVLRLDSHPSHKSKHVRHYMVDDLMLQQLSPPFGVGDVECLFLHHVPSANSMILAAPDFGEEHFAQAFAYILVARNHSVTSSSSPPRSPAMVYYSTDEFLPSHLLVFGAAGKALIHGESRDSKFDEHAKPAVYAGPAVDSDSRAHCAVWPGSVHGRQYVDVDVGCTAFDERTVIDRTRRDHPCTQPYNQVAGKASIDVGKPTSIFDLVGTECSEDQLPSVLPVIWVRSMPAPSSKYVVLPWHGELRPGDMVSWLHELGAQKFLPLPIDLKIGGQEHNISRGVVRAAMLELIDHDDCLGAFLAPRCKPFSASRFNQPGPPVLFDLDHPDGIPDADGELGPEVMIALADVKLVVDIFRTAARNDKVIMLEFPASQGASSPFAAKGRETHSTVADTSMMRKLIDDLGLELVHTEQGAAGADTRKPTTILTTANGAHALRRTVGTLRVPDGVVQTTSLLGQDDSGAYRTQPSERYTPRFAMLLSIAFVGSLRGVTSGDGEIVSSSTAAPATDDLFPVGTRVDVWWLVEKQWYRGTVLETKVRSGKVLGKHMPRREIYVRYDADDQRLWHTLCDNTIREVINEENEPNETVLQLLMSRRRHTLSEPDGALNHLCILDSDALASLKPGDLARRVAKYYMASQRACTSFAAPLDEPMACNGRARADSYREKLIELLSSEADADKLIDTEFEALKAEYSSEDWDRLVTERKSWLAYAATSNDSGPVSLSLALADHVGEVFMMRQLHLDLQDGHAHDPMRMLTVLDDASVVEVDYTQAHGWHVPRNEREYQASPQRDLWRTAKELKMDDYHRVNMFELVPESSVDRSKYTIYDTLWVHKIKWKDGGLVFDKLNPRWCVKGGAMDRDLYKSFAEMMRETSIGLMCGLKASFYDMLAAALFDLSDAFQATSTVDSERRLLPGEQELYTYQAPGFVKYGPNGERLVCRQLCYMQGRIDATAGFDHRLTGIITKSAKFKAMLWDSKVFVYHNTVHSGTVTPLDEVIAEAHAVVVERRDSEPQQPPLGWAMLGQHVDDMQALATGVQAVEDNRILAFVRGEIATVYACKLTGWHGWKLLGFDLRLNDVRRTVYLSAQGTYSALRTKLLTGDVLKITPKHIVTEAVYQSHPGEAPAVGDPGRAAYLERQALIRSALGSGIWLSRAYPQMTSGINAMCVDMANPGEARLAQLRHMIMFLGETPQGKTFGGEHVTSPMHTDVEVKPFTPGAKAGYFHFFSDASVNVTGGVAMFAGGCIQSISLRQHLQSPDSHTSELVAGGTNMNALIPVNGFLQEICVRLGRPTFMYYDSKSTVFVASSDAAPKKSIWLSRRNKVITEAVSHGEAKAVYIPEVDMVADSNTKYIKHVVWARHMHYVLNLPGDPPPPPH